MLREEDDYWTSRVRELSRTQLDTVRKAAGAWSAIFSAVLGIFGAVVFVDGLTGINDLAAGTQSLVRWLIAVALVSALLATVLSGSASIGFPVITYDQTSEGLRDRTTQQAMAALLRFRIAVGFGAMTALIILVGSCLVLFAEKGSRALNVIAVVDGHATCGTLHRQGSSLKLDDAPLSHVDTITVVSSCPN